MSDNSVICAAIQLAQRSVSSAMSNQGSCEAEVEAALGAVRYVRGALRRDSDELKAIKFSLIDPTQTIGSLADPNLTEGIFCETAQRALDMLEELKGICSCPN
jgi:hypothetical protein